MFFDRAYDHIASLTARDIQPWPKGANDSYTDLYDVPLNLTTLKHWNYTLWENRTISNGSKCYLAWDPYIGPTELLPNGTFRNATTCFSAIDSIGTRGHISIALAVLYGFALVFSLVCLNKHGRTYLPHERRFYPIGRRWQWYWACWTCCFAIISLFANIDVDRYYLPELPITLTVFTWYLVCWGMMAQVWEAVRHWGSWQERQYIDPNPFVYRDDDKRSKVEFYLPLFFYFWLWMNFFMTIPRSWKFSQMQRSEEQTQILAIPGATNIRFKLGGFFLAVCWLTVCVSLLHTIRWYRDRHRGLINRSVDLVRAIPTRFYLIIPLALAQAAYQICCAFSWELSLVKIGGELPAVFAWGYGPALLICYVQAIYGWASPNEDKDIIRQRRERGVMHDQELGIVRKPAWWRRVRGDHVQKSTREIIATNVKEVGGGRATGRRVEDAVERQIREDALHEAREDDIEMYPVGTHGTHNPRVDRAGVSAINRGSQQFHSQAYGGKSENRRQERTMQVAAEILFPTDNAVERERARREAELQLDGPAPPPYSDQAQRGRTPTASNGSRPGSNGRSNSTGTTNSITGPPQQVRSMLDI